MIRRTQSLRDGKGIRRRRPEPKAKQPKKPRKTRLPKYLPKTDWDVLLAACASHRDRTLMLVGLYGGLRASEMSALEHGDIDFDEGRIHIRHGKGDKEGYVYVHTLCLDALRQLIYPHGETQEARDAFDPYQPLFFSRKGIKALSRQQIGRIVKGAATRARLRLARGKDGAYQSSVSVHWLRHSCATQMLAAGRTLQEVCEHLRHSSIAVTQIYLHLTERTRRAAAQDM